MTGEKEGKKGGERRETVEEYRFAVGGELGYSRVCGTKVFTQFPRRSEAVP